MRRWIASLIGCAAFLGLYWYLSRPKVPQRVLSTIQAETARPNDLVREIDYELMIGERKALQGELTIPCNKPLEINLKWIPKNPDDQRVPGILSIVPRNLDVLEQDFQLQDWTAERMVGLGGRGFSNKNRNWKGVATSLMLAPGRYQVRYWLRINELNSESLPLVVYLGKDIMTVLPSTDPETECKCTPLAPENSVQDWSHVKGG